MQKEDPVAKIVRINKAGNGDVAQIEKDFSAIEKILGLPIPIDFKRAHIKNRIGYVQDEPIFSASTILEEIKEYDHIFGPFTRNGLIPITGYQSEDYILMDVETSKIYLFEVPGTSSYFEWQTYHKVPPKDKLLNRSDQVWNSYTDFFEEWSKRSDEEEENE